MVYREDATPPTEERHVFPVITHRGLAVVVTLGVFAALALIAAGVTFVLDAPPGVEAYKWPMAIVGAVSLAAAVVRHSYRRRRLVITRTGARHHLVIREESVELEFPVTASGDQLTKSTNGVPMYAVRLKLVDAGQRVIFVTETRGAVYGPQERWLSDTDLTIAGARVEADRIGLCAELLAAVETINARY